MSAWIHSCTCGQLELLAWAVQGQLGNWASLSKSAVGLGVWLVPWFSKCGTQATSSCITWTLWFLSPTTNVLSQELGVGPGNLCSNNPSS